MMDQKQRLEESVRKQVAAEERAFNVVLRLIEKPVSEDYLSDAGQMISPHNYSDVTEERAIGKLCGYPVCGNTLRDMPKQKYHISTRSNRVYEISDRKNFCSNNCYQASKHFAQQILTSPLWSRETSSRIQFTFLKLQKIPGVVGEEVFWSAKELLAKEVEKLKTLDELLESKKLHDFNKKVEDNDSEGQNDDSSKTDDPNKFLTSSDVVEEMASLTLSSTETKSGVTQNAEQKVSDDTHESLSSNVVEAADADSVSENCDKSKTLASHHSTNEEISTVKENRKECQDSLNKPLPGESNSDYVLRLLDNRKNLLGKMADIQPMMQVCEEKKKKKVSENTENISAEISNLDSVSTSTKHTVRSENVEPKSKKHVHKSKRKQLSPLINVGNVIEQWMSMETLQYLGKQKVVEKELKSSDPEIQQNYLKLLKRAEATEKLLDSDDEDEVSSPMKPLPDFKKIQEETEQFQLRVEEFFKGPPKAKSAQKKDSSESDRNVYLPTVDSHDQMQIRRKIVLDRLSKVVPQLLLPLKLTLQDISKEFRDLVYTFRFDSKNILLTSSEWTLVGLVLFRLLCVKMKPVDEAFKQSSFVNFCGVLMEGIGHTQHDLDSIVNKLVTKDYDSLQTSLDITN